MTTENQINYQIIKAKSANIKQIAEIHKKSFINDHFTSLLPNNKLEDYYALCLSHSKFCYIAINNKDNIAGFLIAGNNVDYIINLFKSNNYLIIVKLLLLNPSFIIKKISEIYSSLIYKFFRNKVKLPEYCLLSIATDPATQSKGIGQMLINALENDFINENINEYYLAVRNNNRKAINFYNKQNFISAVSFKGLIFLTKTI